MSRQNPNKNKLLLVSIALVVICLLQFSTEAAAPPSLPVECDTALTTLMSCLGYVTGKAAEPTKDCCTQVSGMKESKPVCLCYVIGQAHNGSRQITSLGIQENKLIQLSSSCQLTNASLSGCPKLLGISPTSPAGAIYMHSNVTSTAGSTPASGSSGGDNSSGMKVEYDGLLAGFLALLVSAFLSSHNIYAHL